MKRMRYVLFLFGLVSATLLFGLVAIVAGYADRRRRWAPRLIPLWSRLLLVLGGVQIRVRGEGSILGKEAIYVANHQSYLDIPVLGTLVPAETLWLAKRELFAIPVFGQALRAVGQIPVDRTNREAARQSIARAARRVRGGEPVILFPEGTRSRDGLLQPFKLGFVHLAAESGVPVVPLVVQGTAELWPRGRWGTCSGEVWVTVLSPVRVPSEVEGDRKREVAAEVRARMLGVAEAAPC